MKNIRATTILLSLFGIALLSCKSGKNESEVKKLPIDTNATTETIDLYNTLFENLKKGTMVGHQDDLAYGHDWYKENGRSDVKDVTGDYPALIGWELGHIELGAEYNLDSVYFSDMRKYIKETYKRGGITTASWHGDNIATGNTAWDCAQDSVVRSVLPNGSNHTKFLKWLDRVGDFFLDLKDDNGNLIPVIFRMYHEHTGSWFWWGAKQCTPDEYKSLWKMTVDYLRDQKKVHNLLYSYSPAETNDEEHYLERYPGDKYVDILGFDCYVPGTDSTALSAYKQAMDRNLNIVTAYASKSGKLPTIGETGMEGIGDSTYFSQAVYPALQKHKVAWVLFWRNGWESDKRGHFYVPYKGHTSSNDFNKFVNNNDIFLNKDIRK